MTMVARRDLLAIAPTRNAKTMVVRQGLLETVHTKSVMTTVARRGHRAPMESVHTHAVMRLNDLLVAHGRMASAHIQGGITRRDHAMVSVHIPVAMGEMPQHAEPGRPATDPIRSEKIRLETARASPNIQGARAMLVHQQGSATLARVMEQIAPPMVSVVLRAKIQHQDLPKAGSTAMRKKARLQILSVSL
jgi:hypothetical protein